jgi:hypothetical protein
MGLAPDCKTATPNAFIDFYGTHPTSLVMEEFLEVDLGDISKSESDLYRKDSRRAGRFWRTRPGLEPSSASLPGLAPFSTSKLKEKKQSQPSRNSSPHIYQKKESSSH